MKLFLSILALSIFMTFPKNCFALFPTNQNLMSCKKENDYLSPLNNNFLNILKEINQAITPPPAPIKVQIKKSLTNNPWKDEYTNFLYQALVGDSFQLLLNQEINLEDLEKINCPNFNTLNKEDKINFYIHYLASIAESTSNFNNDEEYYSKEDKTTNYGLLQIDPKSAMRHAGSALGKSVSGKELKNYQVNLLAGSYILKHQISGKYAKGRLFPEKTYYWTELTSKKNQILTKLKNVTKDISSCQNRENEDLTREDRDEVLSVVPSDNSGNILENEKTNREDTDNALRVVPSIEPEGHREDDKTKRENKNNSKGNTPTMPEEPIVNTSRLHVKEFIARVNSLPEVGDQLCARGVRKSLNVLIYGDIDKGVTDGPNAKGYDENQLGKWTRVPDCFIEISDKINDFKNFDIRVMQPIDIGEFGHIEIFFEGIWYSDFKQKDSLWNNGSKFFKEKKRFRFTNSCTFASLRLPDLNYISSFFISEVFAEDKVSAKDVIDENTPFPTKKVQLASVGIWSVQEKYENQGSYYILYKKDPSTKKEVEIDRDSNSFYVLIHKIKDKKLQRDLAEEKLKNWIKEDGKSAVQKKILEFEALTEVQKESYIKAGFKLPKFFTIIFKN